MATEACPDAVAPSTQAVDARAVVCDKRALEGILEWRKGGFNLKKGPPS